MFTIESDELRRIAGNIGKEAEDLRVILNSISSTNANVRETWDSEAANKFTSKVSEMEAMMKKLPDALVEAQEGLTEAANKYDKAEEEVNSLMN